MKSFFVICFLTIFAVVGSDEEINWSKVRSKFIDISPVIKFRASKGVSQEKVVVGGKEAVPHSFPYQVGLLFENSKGQLIWCSGSLITTEYVLTAAHCLDKMEEATVFLGSHNVNKQTDGELRIKVPKINFIIHEKWGSAFTTDNIGLVKLPNPVELTPNIQLLYLPPRSLTKLTGVLVTATGWGATSSSSKISAALRYVEVKVVPEVDCTAYYQYLIGDTNVCTIDRKTPCFGDNGGPIVIQSNGSITIVGLVSFNAFGCKFGWPVAYTRITSFLDWISSNTGLAIKD